MTADIRTAQYDPPADAPTGAAARPWPQLRAVSAISDRTAFIALLAILFVMYGLLQNRYWVPAGDSELYTVAARNLATGQGYTFNGQPVAIIPIGWSLMMAAVMKVTPYILPLKLMAMTCVIASLAISYWIVRRFTSPSKALAIIVLTAIISHIYQATYWLISESAFCLATSASLLLAMQINEGKRQWWRMALLIFACAAAVMFRWAGVIGIILVIALLLDKELRPRLTAPWVLSIVIAITTIGTFFAQREALKGTPEEAAAAADMVTGTGEDIGVPVVPDTGPPISGAANQSAKAYHFFPTGSYADRFLNWGRWFSYLYWQPFRAAAASAALIALSSVTGWILILLLAVLVIVTIRKRQWIWLGLGMYTGMLALGWSNVNARYYVPVTFLITLGVFLATDELTAMLSRWPRWRRTIVALFALFIGSVVVCNTALYAVEVAIARSDRFYNRYEDGIIVPLISACQYLTKLPDPPADKEIAISQRYTNLNRNKPSPFGLRAGALLTGREIKTPRYRDTNTNPMSNDKKARELRKWLRGQNVKWYIHQNEVSPWRVWHFRLDWYQRWQIGNVPEQPKISWQLYRVNGSDLIPVKVPSKCQPVTRVPGL